MREKKKIEDATKKKKTNYKNACAFVALDNSYETGHSLWIMHAVPTYQKDH